ncbi:MAG: chemoreceptor glutamine deamidase CheD [Leptospirillia bacterium]
MIRRHNARFNKDSCVIVAGDYFATKQDMVIETVLGSCIAVCLLDEKNGITGMNHFMLPADRGGGSEQRAGRYGTNAMELLINEMMHLGADRFSIRAKVFGGGNVNTTSPRTLRVGDWNTQFALDFLKAEGFPVASKDVGGNTGRRIVLFTETGNVKLRRLGQREVGDVLQEEIQYRSRIVEQPPTEHHEGELTLF